MEFLNFIDKNSGSLGVVVTVIIAILGFWHYLSTRAAEERGKKYDRYHKLLEDLNIGAHGGGPFLDRQTAVIYELRNFPDYYPVSLRILESSLPRWRELKMEAAMELAFDRSSRLSCLYDEAVLTIKYIKRRQLETSYLCIPEEDRR